MSSRELIDSPQDTTRLPQRKTPDNTRGRLRKAVSSFINRASRGGNLEEALYQGHMDVCARAEFDPLNPASQRSVPIELKTLAYALYGRRTLAISSVAVHYEHQLAHKDLTSRISVVVNNLDPRNITKRQLEWMITSGDNRYGYAAAFEIGVDLNPQIAIVRKYSPREWMRAVLPQESKDQSVLPTPPPPENPFVTVPLTPIVVWRIADIFDPPPEKTLTSQERRKRLVVAFARNFKDRWLGSEVDQSGVSAPIPPTLEFSMRQSARSIPT